MKFLVFLITLLTLNTLSLDIKDVRVAYRDAAHNDDKVTAFNNLVASVTKNDDVALVAYKGAAITMKAKIGGSIKEKKEFLKEGVSYIEFAIEKAPNDIEPRFVRIGVQENTPRIVGYKDNIDEDKAFILKHYSNIKSTDLKNHIKDYILESKLFSDEEKQITN